MAKFIQLFRNQLSAPFADKATAKAALEVNNIDPKVLKDGMPIIARYETNGPGSAIKTLLGIAHVSGSTVSVTVFDSGSIDELDATISAATDGGTQITIVQTDGVLSSVSLTDIDLETLSNYDKGSDSGSVTSADTISEAIAKLENQIDSKLDALDSDITASANTYFSKIAIVDGKLDSTGSTQTNIDAAQIVDYTKMTTGAKQSLSTGDTIDSAIEKLEWNIDLVENKVDDLDFTGVTNETSKVITDVTETDGLVAASATSVSDLTLSTITTADTKVAVDDSLGNAIGKLQGQIDSMDLSVVSGTGQAIVSVSESDGKVSATTGDIAAEHVTIADADEAFSATTVEGALAELAGKVSANEIESSGKTIVIATGASKTNIEVNIDGDTIIKDANGMLSADVSIVKTTTGLPETIKERYQLQTSSGTTLGANIDVPKDSHIVSITYITDSGDTHYQHLEYVYVDVSGNTKTEYVDISSLVLEAEFASGVTITNHVAHGVVDSTSEKDSNNDSFLTVGADGFKVDGIKDEIDAKINALDATGGTQTIATGKHVAVEVVETDGKITAVTVVEDNIADADDLTEISNRLGTGVTTANTATAQLAALSGNTASTSGETSVEGAKRYADAKLSEVVEGLDATVTGATSGSHVTISIEELDGKLVQSGLTIEENDIASNTDLGNLSAKTVTEIGSSNNSITVSTAATTANDGTVKYDVITDGSKIHLDNYEKATGSSAVTTADTVNDAIGKLEYKVDAASTDLQTEVDNIETAVGLDSDGTHLTSAGHYTSGASTIEDEIVALDTQLSAVSNTYISDIVESSGITVTTGASAASGETATVSLKLSTTAQTGTVTDMLVFNSDNGLAMSDTWDCGFYSSPANP